MSKKRALILFTNDFPYGEGEYFVEKEYPYLAAVYDRILIITTISEMTQTRNVMSNTLLYKYPYHCSVSQKIISLFTVIMMRTFYREIKTIRTIYKKRIKYFQIKSMAFALFKGKKVRSFVEKLIRKNHLEDHDIFIYSYWMDNMSIAVAMIKNKHPQYKCFCRAHGWDLYFERDKNEYLPLRKFVLDNLNAVYCISNNAKTYLQDLLKNDFQNIIVSKLGTKPVCCSRKENTKEGLFFVSISTLYEVKRINLLIESLSVIDNIKVRWVHIGGGYGFEYVKDYSQKLLESKENVCYELKGEMKNEEVLKYLACENIDMLINVSSSEGIPVSIMEAMSCKIPVIATDVGGVREIVNEDNGILIPLNSNAKDIADAIVAFHDLPEEIKKGKSEAAYKTWDENYKADKNYMMFINSIMEL